ncbi:MAG: ATP-binding protein [Desulfovibrionaceae bacterium]
MSAIPCMQKIMSGSEIEKVLQTVLDYMMGGVGLFEVSETIKPLFYNQGLRQIISDYTEEDMATFHENAVFNIFPEDVALIYTKLAKSLENMQPFETEYREFRKDGGVRYMQCRVTPVPFESSNNPVYLGIFNEITVQKEFQLEVEKERQRYKLALETSKDVVFEYDVAKDVFFAYESSEKDNAGLVKTECKRFSARLSLLHVAHPDDMEQVFAAICQGKKCISTVRLRRFVDPKSDFSWFSVRSTVVHDDAGMPIRVVGTLRNMDEQKLLSGIVDRFVYDTCDYFVFLDAAHNSYIMYSKSTCGTPLPATEGGNYSEEVIRYAHAHVVERDIALSIEGMKLETVLRELDKNDEYILYVGVNDPERGYTHKKIRYVYYDRQKQQILLTRIDVTHLYQEEQRKNFLLRDALHTAELANNAKTDFLSRMSHDIRTPLNAITGMTALALRKLHEPEKMQDCLTKITISSQYLLSLINAILDMSKIESGKLLLAESVFSFENIVHDICNMVRPQAQAMHIDFRIDVRGPIAVFFGGDVTRISQILMNLLSNALKFTPAQGKVSLQIFELSRQGNMAVVEFQVQDTGVGISPEFMEKLFEPFEQERSDYARNLVGSGLGLPIVKNFVELMGGSIDVKSTQGEGTLVTVQIPLKIVDDASMPPVVETPQGGDVAPSFRFAGEAVLLVEDNEINLEIAKALLEEVGLRVTCAVNGQQAVDIFNQSAVGYYALILIDIRMPVLDGIAATQILRKLPRSDAQQTPIIAMTANAFDEDRRDALAAGMNGYLTKPVQPMQLYQEIANSLYVTH